MISNLMTALAGIVDDISLLVGAGLISYGAFAIYEPAGYIVSGVFFLMTGYLVAARREKKVL